MWRTALFLMVIILRCGDASAWDCSWGHRIEAAIATGASAYSGEVRVDLTAADIPSSYTFSTSGEDVRVVRDDDTTPVDHLVTDWNPAARTATLYVNVGTLTANSTTNILIYIGNGAVSSLGDATAVFPQSGLRLQSRVSSADPTTSTEARTAFANATNEIYNQARTSISGENNRGLGGSNGNFGWCVSGLVEVTPATAGNWGFRYGADFGRGGDLKVAGVVLEEQWNDDLWWAFNFNNTNETLEGTITLTPGWHRYEAVGFEGCCDGAVGWQARRPGGAWQDMNTTNFSMRAAQCVPPVTLTLSAPESCTTVLDASKLMDVVSDPFGHSDPYAVSGSIIEYEITLANPGQAVDAGTVNLVDALPSEVSLIVEGAGAFSLAQGSVASGLSLTWNGPNDLADDVAFSTDGVDFTYQPSGTGPNLTDSAVTHVQFSPKGVFAAYSEGGGTPSVTLRFQAVVD